MNATKTNPHTWLQWTQLNTLICFWCIPIYVPYPCEGLMCINKKSYSKYLPKCRKSSFLGSFWKREVFQICKWCNWSRINLSTFNMISFNLLNEPSDQDKTFISSQINIFHLCKFSKWTRKNDIFQFSRQHHLTLSDPSEPERITSYISQVNIFHLSSDPSEPERNIFQLSRKHLSTL